MPRKISLRVGPCPTTPNEGFCVEVFLKGAMFAIRGKYLPGDLGPREAIAEVLKVRAGDAYFDLDRCVNECVEEMPAPA